MKLSKKYQRKIKKRILGCISSIAICLMLIAGGRLAGLSTPISNLKNFSAKSTADETKKINNINEEEGFASVQRLDSLTDVEEIELNVRNEYIKVGQALQLQTLGTVGAEDTVPVEIENSIFTWDSSNEDVATVDENGVVTGIGIGHTTITAYNETSGLKAKAIINVYRNKEGAITVPQVEIGEGFTVVLKEDGTVWTAGQNNYGQLGDGTTTNRNTLMQVKIDESTYLTNVKKISVGFAHVVALTKTGQVYGWGINSLENAGDLGQGDTINRAYAVKIKGVEGVGYLENIIDIACGDMMTYALNNDGKIFGTGSNGANQINDNGGTILYPTEVTGIKNAVKLTAGYSDFGAILSNGETWVKGHNPHGAFGNGVTSSMGGQYLVGTDINEIELGGYFASILKEDGTVWATGLNSSGQLGLGDTTNREKYTEVKYENGDIVKAKTISTGDYSLQFIGEDGKVYVTGYNGRGQLSNGTIEKALYPSTMKNQDGTEVIDTMLLISGGRSYYQRVPLNMGIIRQDGSIWLSGDNTYGQLGNESNTSTNYLTQYGTNIVTLNKRNEYIKMGESIDIDVLEASEFNVFIKDINQNEWTWDSSNEDVATLNENGIVTGTGVGYTTITAYNEATGLKGRAIINVYRNHEGAITVPQVVSGERFTVVLKEDGTVWASGQNNVGQLGDGTTTNKNEPVQVRIDDNTYLTNVRKISVGREWASALTIDGKVYVWGYNDLGQLSQGDTATLLYAKQAKIDENTYIENAIDISAGEVHLMVLAKDGRVYVAGHNYWYQNLTTGREQVIPYLKDTRLTNAIKVDAGYANCSAMISNGKTYAWGHNQYGAIETAGNPTLKYLMAEDAIDIKVNGYFTVMQKENGEVYVSGLNNVGQLGLGDNTNRNVLTKIELPKDENGNIEKIKYISGSVSNIMLMTVEGKIYVSGYNGYGQLCTGDTTNSNVFIPLVNSDGTKVTNALLLNGGENINYNENNKNLSFIKEDGTVWISGDNTYGQMGNGTNASINYLTQYGTNTVTLNKRNEYIKMGESIDIDVLEAFGFNVFTKDTLNQNEWTWTSSNEDVAIVNENGVVTGVGIGHATITTYNKRIGLKGKAIINVYRNHEGAITVPQVVLGEWFTVVLKEDGTVWTSGLNNNGQLGDGTTLNRNEQIQVRIDENTYLTNVKKIAVGDTHTLALTLNGEVYAWGYNGYGHLGQGDTTTRIYATKVKGVEGVGYLENIIDISCGEVMSYAVNDRGNIFGFGQNSHLQMIDTSNGANLVYPVEVVGIKNAIKVTSGYSNIGAILSNGEIWVKGHNERGAFGNGVTATIGGQYLVGTDINEIELGGYFGAILKEDGTIWTTGRNEQGQLGLGDIGDVVTDRKIYTQVKYENGDIVKAKTISRGSFSLQFIGEDGKVYVTGYNGYGQLSNGTTENSVYPTAMKNADGTEVTDCLLLATGGMCWFQRATLNMGMIKQDGTVWISGDNTYGQLGNGSNTSTNYLTQYGTNTVTLNKRNEYIKVGESVDIDVLEASEFNVFIKDVNQTEWNRWTSSNDDVATVDENGIVTGTGVGYTTITAYNEATGLKGRAIINVYRNHEGAITVPQVVHGDSFMTVLKEDGTVWTSGQNNVGQLGDGTTTNKNKPIQVKIDEDTYLTNVRKIAVGREWAVALTLDGKVYTWGCNDYGQLSQGDTTNRLYAVQAKIDENTYIKDAIDISAGDAHLMVLTDNGKLYVAGNNYWYQNLTTGRENVIPYLKDTRLSNVIKMDAGYSNCTAMLQNGKTLCWGHNAFGALANNGNPALPYVIADDAVDIKLSAYTIVLQKENGEIYGIGKNRGGQLALGNYTDINKLTKIEIPTDENGNTEKIKYITETANNTILMTVEGKVYVTGSNEYGQLCTGDTATTNTFIPLKNRDGSIVTDCLLLEDYGENSNYSGENSGTGYSSTRGLALIRKDGTVWVAGDNDWGQMGNATNIDTNYLTRVGQDTVKLNKNNEYIKVGESIDIDVLEASGFNVFIQDTLDQNEWTWESSNEDVAKVDENGVITGVGVGYTTITTYNEKIGLKGKVIINVYRDKVGAITVPGVSHGDSFTVVLKEDGSVWTSGANNLGQLGDGTTTNKNEPVQVKIDENTYLTNVRKISVGREWASALTIDGKVYVWGYNDLGQLAQGDTTTLLYAKQAKIDENTYIENAIDISAGDCHFMVLTKEGKLYVAGHNAYYQNLTTGRENVIAYLKDTGLNNVIKIDSGYSNCSAMLSNGKTIGWGFNAYGALETKPSPTLPYVIADDAVDIDINAHYTIIQKENGEIYVTGRNEHGQLGLGDNTNRNVLTKIELPKDENGNTEKIKYISGTSGNIMLMTVEGKIYISGYNGFGQLGTGDTADTTKFIPLVNRDKSIITDALLLEEHGENSFYTSDDRNNGYSNSRGLAFIRQNGTVWISGDNSWGQIGDKTNNSTNYLTQYATNTVTLNKKNEYIRIGENIDIDVLETSGFNVFIEDTLNQKDWNKWTSSNEDVAIVDETGRVTGVSVGQTTITVKNEKNGLKGRAIINVYRNHEGAITVPEVAHGDTFTAVLKEDGTVWTTGYNNLGQLGDGTTTNKNEPVQVRIDENTYLTNVRKISVGQEWASALTIDGKVYNWGWNGLGQLARGDTTNLLYAKLAKIDENTYIENAIDISAGDQHLMVATNNGKVYVVGQNQNYQNLTTGREQAVTYLKDTGLTNVIKVDAGYSNCSAMLQNGKTLAWGHNGYGALETKPQPTLSYAIADDAVDIKLNGFYTIIRKENEEIYVTGRNEQGQLGLGDNTNRNVLTKIEIPKNENGKEEKIKYISGTSGNIMLMTVEGKIYVTGHNGFGQLGTGDTVNTNTFIPLVNKDGSKVIDCLLLGGDGENSNYPGNNTGLAFIRQDGTVWMSGDNTLGQIGDWTNTSTNYLTQYGADIVTLNKRNEYIKIGESIDIDVLEGSKFNVFIKDMPNQNEWTWTSSNEDVATIDQSGILTGTGVGYTTITAYNETLGLKGKAIINVYRNKEGAITVPEVAHGDTFTVVLKEDGTVWTSGQNNVGQLGDGTTENKNEQVQVKIDENTYLTNVRKIAVGSEWASALTLDGKIYTWGYNHFGQLAQGDTTTLLYAKPAKIDETTYMEDAIDISAGDVHIMAITKDGKVYVVGHNYYYQNLTTGRENVNSYFKDTRLTNAIKVDAGTSNCSAMLQNGKTLAWGYNAYGELETKPNPTLQYVIAEDVVDIELKGVHTIIQKENGEIYVTGYNAQGQLGLGDNNNRNTLTKIEIPKDENGKEEKIKYISGTEASIMLMTVEGKIYVSGYNGFGQLCTGDTNNSNTFIPLVNKDGSKVTDALLLGGDGENSNHQGDSRGLAFIRKDGIVWMSGDNSVGQIGDGTNTSTNYLTEFGTMIIRLNKNDEYIKVEESIDIDVLEASMFNVFIKDMPNQNEWTWDSSNKSVAVVDSNGIVTGKDQGHTIITAYNAETGLEAKTIINVYRDPIICESIVQGVRDLDLENGNYTFRIKGNIEESEETIDYDVELINYYGDMTYSLEEGETERIVSLGDSLTDYKMLVVKYHGDLTIDKGVTLTANTVDNLTYKKGMYICVLGDTYNNGTISMTARGTYNQEGENVYLWKNIDASYEYIPAVGGTGGEAQGRYDNC